MSGSNPLAKECVEFIRTLLSSPDFANGCSSSVKLCKILGDGEILCSLLAELSQGQISAEAAYTTSFYSKNSQLLAKRNISYFLKQCQKVFGINEQELFEADDLLSLSDPDRVVKALHSLLQQKCRARSAPVTRNSGVLANIVQEICEHEKLLTDKLLKLLLFRKELLGVLSEWSEELVSVVFRYADQLYILHKELFYKLTGLAAKGCEHFCQNLGHVFADMVPRLEIYFQYFSHLPTATAQMEAELEQSPEMKDQMEMLEKQICEPNTFYYVYEAPIRQVTNYLQLFKRLVKTAAKEAPDTRQSVERALGELETLLNRANVYKGQAEQTGATTSVLSEVAGLPQELTKPAEIGLLQADASFRVRYQPGASRDRKESRELCSCILTTKYLFVSSRLTKKDPLTYWFTVPIAKVQQMKRKDPTTLELTLEADARVKLEEHKTPGSLGSEKWLGLLEEARAECFPTGWDRSGHRFKLLTFSSGTDCHDCGAVMNGSVLQGYQCEHCSCRVDLGCLKNQANKKCQPKRVGLAANARPDEFFHATADRSRAMELLSSKPNGAFLIRPKGGENSNQRVMSLKVAGEVVHIEIFEDSGKFALGLHQQRWFSTMDEMISFYKKTNMSRHFSSLDCTLTFGVPRTD